MSYEILKPDGTTQTLDATGYSLDHSQGSIRFYDYEARPVATFVKGEWIRVIVAFLAMTADSPVTIPIAQPEFHEL